MQPLSRKEVMRMRTEFCKENKISSKYRRQRNTLIVNFRQLEEYSADFYEKTNQRDFAKLKKKMFVSPNILETMYYEELMHHIESKLSKRGNQIFKLLIYEGLKQIDIAKELHITTRTVRRYITKIKGIVRKYKA